MIEFDDRNIKTYEKDLKLFAKNAYPYASRNTVNESAFFGRKKAQQIIKRRMINRNKWTIGSIQVDPTRSLNPRNQMAIMGSVAPYMEDQEFGTTINKTGKQGVSIPTSFSAGMSLGARPRTRLPRKPNKMANIRLRHLRNRGSRKQRNMIAVRSAAASGQKYIYMNLGRRKGIFKVVGGKRAPQIRMVHDLSHKSVTINPSPWLQPAIKRTINKIPSIYEKSLIYQLKRNRIFNY